MEDDRRKRRIGRSQEVKAGRGKSEGQRAELIRHGTLDHFHASSALAALKRHSMTDRHGCGPSTPARSLSNLSCLRQLLNRGTAGIGPQHRESDSLLLEGGDRLGDGRILLVSLEVEEEQVPGFRPPQRE